MTTAWTDINLGTHGGGCEGQRVITNFVDKVHTEGFEVLKPTASDLHSNALDQMCCIQLGNKTLTHIGHSNTKQATNLVPHLVSRMPISSLGYSEVHFVIWVCLSRFRF